MKRKSWEKKLKFVSLCGNVVKLCQRMMKSSSRNWRRKRIVFGGRKILFQRKSFFIKLILILRQEISIKINFFTTSSTLSSNFHEFSINNRLDSAQKLLFLSFHITSESLSTDDLISDALPIKLWRIKTAAEKLFPTNINRLKVRSIKATRLWVYEILCAFLLTIKKSSLLNWGM